ncbi:MAG: universal stress protein [Kofleriaceae bacterium]
MLAKNILVPTDFSECSMHALDYACELAQRLDASIHLVNCVSVPPEINIALTQEMVETLRSGAEQALDKLVSRPGVRFARPQVVSMDPREGILDAAQRTKADLIVLGTHGRRGFTRFMLGSVAEGVLRRATCPVLTLRGGAS